MIKDFLSLYQEIYNNTFGIEHFIFLFFSVCVVLFWFAYAKAIYHITKHYLKK